MTVAARHPETFLDLYGGTPEGITTVGADVRDADSVERALGGHDAVIVAVSGTVRRVDGLYSAAGRAIATTAPRVGATRAMIISSGGVHQDDPALPFWYRRILIPFVMKEMYDNMRLMEERVRDSALDWTIVRAAYLNDRPARGTFRVLDGTTPPGGWRLTRGDLAEFTVDQLASDTWLRKTPTLAD